MDAVVVRAMVSLDALERGLARTLELSGWIDVAQDDPRAIEVRVAGHDEARAASDGAAAWLPSLMPIETLARALADVLATDVVVVTANFPVGMRGEDPSASRATATPGEAPSRSELDDEAEEIASDWRSDGPLFEEGEAAYELASALADVPGDLPTRRLRWFARNPSAKLSEILARVQTAASWAWTTSRGRPALRLMAADGTARLQVLDDAQASELRPLLEQLARA